LPSIRKSTFKEKTILSAWQKSGLFPHDVRIALKRIKVYKEPVPPLPPLITSTSAINSTPKSLQHTKDSAEQWKKKLDSILSSPSKRQFESFVKGNESQLLHAQITKHEITQIRLAFKERLKASDKARKYTVGKGPIKVKDRLKAVEEKNARQRKTKGKRSDGDGDGNGSGSSKGKGKEKAKAETTSFVLDVASDYDDIDAYGETDDDFITQNPELAGFRFGDSVPDPFLENDDYVGLS